MFVYYSYSYVPVTGTNTRGKKFILQEYWNIGILNIAFVSVFALHQLILQLSLLRFVYSICFVQIYWPVDMTAISRVYCFVRNQTM